jgi:hypothetical protein
MAQEHSELQQIIEALKRQRVRQGDFKPVLEYVVVQARVIEGLSSTGTLAEIAGHMKARALELQRIHNSVPKFVVEDLLEQSIAQLERAKEEATLKLAPRNPG